MNTPPRFIDGKRCCPNSWCGAILLVDDETHWWCDYCGYWWEPEEKVEPYISPASKEQKKAALEYRRALMDRDEAENVLEEIMAKHVEQQNDFYAKKRKASDAYMALLRSCSGSDLDPREVIEAVAKELEIEEW